MGSTSTAAPDPTPGLRERKKRRTRDALVDAAHRLFLSQGYARTTVDEIAAAVDVSQRTFFRYFANKEEAALAVLADADDDFVRRLADRPAEEPPLTALRAAVCASWRELGSAAAEDAAGDGPHGSRGVSAALELLELIESTPTLLAAQLRRSAEQEQRVAAILAAREGLDPAADLRPGLLAAVFAAAIRTAHLAWSGTDERQRAAGPEGMIAVIERHLDQLGPALAAGHWPPTTGDRP
jgi:AcrR family transcriptional regulator